MNAATDILDVFCAPRGGVIRLGREHKLPFTCTPMDDGWKSSIAESGHWWGMPETGREKEEDPRFDRRMFDLRDGLIHMGGEAACMPWLEEDLDKILARGQLWAGHNLKMMRGAPNQCHSNSCLLLEANQDKPVFLATGYALSEKGGMWRQHSWCVQAKPRGARILETTEPRELYFGFVMTLEETLEFADNNTDFGIEISPESRLMRESIEGFLKSFECRAGP